MGMSAETTVASASATPASKKTFFNMLKSPRGFELISEIPESTARLRAEDWPKGKLLEAFGNQNITGLGFLNALPFLSARSGV
jgi:hypothetical protein